jgi:xanthine dehydrogenase iron-sulfur cluster and FAD-binding subunit A
MLEPFTIHQPVAVSEASELLNRFGPDAAVYAGGTELLVVMKERLAHFPHLVDIKRIPGLREIEYDEDSRMLTIGALATHREIERSPLVREQLPSLAALASSVANIRVRSAGTIGGNLCFAEPHSDPATLLTALEAQLTLTAAGGSRTVPIADFFTGILETVRRHDEILTGIAIPAPAAGSGIAYERFKLHERPTAAVAAIVMVEDGLIRAARVVAGSVGERPQLLTRTMAFLLSQPANDATANSAVCAIGDEVATTSDAFESEAYKRQLTRVVGRRAIAVPRARRVRAMPPETFAPPLISLEMTVNGQPVALAIESRAILLDVLRDRLGLTGAKRSCDSQVCGACTVLLDGLPVSACCTLAYEAVGREVETIEGLAGPDGLHPIQQAFVENAAIQCGFCTPGFVLTAKALLTENPHPSRAEIEAYLGGNLCRCTGYWNILAAVEDAANRLSPLAPNPPESTPIATTQSPTAPPRPPQWARGWGEGSRGKDGA